MSSRDPGPGRPPRRRKRGVGQAIKDAFKAGVDYAIGDFIDPGDNTTYAQRPRVEGGAWTLPEITVEVEPTGRADALRRSLSQPGALDGGTGALMGQYEALRGPVAGPRRPGPTLESEELERSTPEYRGRTDTRNTLQARDRRVRESIANIPFLPEFLEEPLAESRETQLARGFRPIGEDIIEGAAQDAERIGKAISTTSETLDAIGGMAPRPIRNAISAAAEAGQDYILAPAAERWADTARAEGGTGFGRRVAASLARRLGAGAGVDPEQFEDLPESGLLEEMAGDLPAYAGAYGLAGRLPRIAGALQGLRGRMGLEAGIGAGLGVVAPYEGTEDINPIARAAMGAAAGAGGEWAATRALERVGGSQIVRETGELLRNASLQTRAAIEGFQTGQVPLPEEVARRAEVAERHLPNLVATRDKIAVEVQRAASMGAEEDVQALTQQLAQAEDLIQVAEQATRAPGAIPAANLGASARAALGGLEVPQIGPRAQGAIAAAAGIGSVAAGGALGGEEGIPAQVQDGDLAMLGVAGTTGALMPRTVAREVLRTLRRSAADAPLDDGARMLLRRAIVGTGQFTVDQVIAADDESLRRIGSMLAEDTQRAADRPEMGASPPLAPIEVQQRAQEELNAVYDSIDSNPQDERLRAVLPTLLEAQEYVNAGRIQTDYEYDQFVNRGILPDPSPGYRGYGPEAISERGAGGVPQARGNDRVRETGPGYTPEQVAAKVPFTAYSRSLARIRSIPTASGTMEQIAAHLATGAPMAELRTMGVRALLKPAFMFREAQEAVQQARGALKRANKGDGDAQAAQAALEQAEANLRQVDQETRAARLQPVDRDELIALAERNQIQIGEVVQGERDQRRLNELDALIRNHYNETDRLRESARELMDRAGRVHSAPAYEGDEDAKAVLVAELVRKASEADLAARSPERSEVIRALHAEQSDLRDRPAAQYKEWGYPGGSNYRVVLLTEVGDDPMTHAERQEMAELMRAPTYDEQDFDDMSPRGLSVRNLSPEQVRRMGELVQRTDNPPEEEVIQAFIDQRAIDLFDEDMRANPRMYPPEEYERYMRHAKDDPGGSIPEEIWTRANAEFGRDRYGEPLPRPGREGASYESSHFADVKGYLAHMRADDVTLPDGSKALRVWELQSDRFQDGVKYGYRDEDAIRELKKKEAALVDRHEALKLSMPPSGQRDAWAAEASDIRKELADVRGDLADLEQRKIPGHPLQNLGDWTGTVIKRIIDEAVKGGYSMVILPTPEDQKTFYPGLEQIYRRIQYSPATGRLRAWQHGDRYQPSMVREVEPENLGEYVGDELAERILSAPLTPWHAALASPYYKDPSGGQTLVANHEMVQAIEGPELKVGGKGMDGYYGKVVPREIRAYAKRVGVTIDLEPVRLRDEDAFPRYIPYDEKDANISSDDVMALAEEEYNNGDSKDGRALEALAEEMGDAGVGAVDRALAKLEPDELERIISRQLLPGTVTRYPSRYVGPEPTWQDVWDIVEKAREKMPKDLPVPYLEGGALNPEYAKVAQPRARLNELGAVANVMKDKGVSFYAAMKRRHLSQDRQREMAELVGGRMEEYGHNPAFKVTPELIEAVKTGKVPLLIHPAIAMAALGATVDQDDPQRGIVVGAGAGYLLSRILRGGATKVAKAAMAAADEPVRFSQVSATDFEAARAAWASTDPRYMNLTQGMSLEGGKPFLSGDGQTGFVIGADGELQNLFSANPGRGAQAIREAIAKGATWGSTLNKGLERYYKRLGAVERLRVPFDESQMAPGWDVETMGRPDYVEWDIPNTAKEKAAAESAQARLVRPGADPRKPNPVIRAVAEKYVDQYKWSGINVDDAHLVPAYEPVPEDEGRRLADLFDASENMPWNPEIQISYRAFKHETLMQYNTIIEQGYTIEPWLQDGQPYANSAEMLADLVENKHLYFFLTRTGFGPGGVEAAPYHPLLELTEIVVNGEELFFNDLFRAVHDFFGHGPEGNQFGARGEHNAWIAHARMYSEKARLAMANETRLQNSWVNFGAHLRRPDGTIPQKGEEGYIPLADRPYADQKIIWLPPELVHPPGTKAYQALQRNDPSFQPRMGQQVTIERTLMVTDPDAAEYTGMYAVGAGVTGTVEEIVPGIGAYVRFGAPRGRRLTMFVQNAELREPRQRDPLREGRNVFPAEGFSVNPRRRGDGSDVDTSVQGPAGGDVTSIMFRMGADTTEIGPDGVLRSKEMVPRLPPPPEMKLLSGGPGLPPPFKEGRAIITQEAQSYGRHGYKLKVPDDRAAAFTREAADLLNLPDGHVIEKVLRIAFPDSRARVVQNVAMRGVWAGDLNPMTGIAVEGATNVEMDFASAVLGVLYGQDAEHWTRRIRSEGSPESSPGWVVMSAEGGDLPEGTLQEILEVLKTKGEDGELAYPSLVAATVNTEAGAGQILFRNYTELSGVDHDAFLNELQAALTQVAARGAQDIRIATATFEGKILHGPRYYSGTIGQRTDALRFTRDFLAEHILPHREGWAASTGGDPESVRSAIGETLRALDEVTNELENKPPAGNTTGRIVPVVARALSTKHRAIPKGYSTEQRRKVLYGRFESMIQEFLDSGFMARELAEDFYGITAIRSVAIGSFVQPELREVRGRFWSTVFQSIASNGQEVVDEVEVGLRVSEQFFDKRVISLLKAGTAKYTTTPMLSVDKHGKESIRPSISMSGAPVGGFVGEAGFVGIRGLAHEQGYKRLEKLILALGEQKAMEWLLDVRRYPKLTWSGKPHPKAGQVWISPKGKNKGQPILNLQRLLGEKIGRYAADKLEDLLLAQGPGITADSWEVRAWWLLTGYDPPIRKATKKDVQNEVAKKVGELIVDATATPMIKGDLDWLHEEYARLHGGMKPSAVQSLSWFSVKYQYRLYGAREKALAYTSLSHALAQVLTDPHRLRLYPGGADRVISMGDAKEHQVIAPGRSPEEGWSTDNIWRDVAKQEGWSLGEVDDTIHGRGKEANTNPEQLLKESGRKLGVANTPEQQAENALRALGLNILDEGQIERYNATRHHGGGFGQEVTVRGWEDAGGGLLSKEFYVADPAGEELGLYRKAYYGEWVDKGFGIVLEDASGVEIPTPNPNPINAAIPGSALLGLGEDENGEDQPMDPALKGILQWGAFWGGIRALGGFKTLQKAGEQSLAFLYSALKKTAGQPDASRTMRYFFNGYGLPEQFKALMAQARQIKSREEAATAQVMAQVRGRLTPDQLLVLQRMSRNHQALSELTQVAGGPAAPLFARFHALGMSLVQKGIPEGSAMNMSRIHERIALMEIMEGIRDFRGPKGEQWWKDVPPKHRVSPSDEYVRLPSHLDRGPLRGKLVRFDIVDELERFYNLPKMIKGHTKYGTYLATRFKGFMTAYNPPTWVTNVGSNLITGDLGGVLPWTDPKTWKAYGNSARLLARWAKDGTPPQPVQEAIAAGLLDADMQVSAELTRVFNALSSSDTPEAATEKLIRHLQEPRGGALGAAGRELTEFGGWIDSKVSAWYQSQDSWFKLATFLRAREKGRSPEQAAELANQWFFDYGDVSPFIERLRTKWYGPLFVTWSVKMAPRFLEFHADHPLKAMMWLAILGGVGTSYQSKLEEEEKPEYMRPRFPGDPGGINVAARGDPERLVNSRKLYPTPSFYDQNAYEGIPDAMQAIGLGGNPFYVGLTEALTGENMEMGTLRGRAYREHASLPEQAAEMLGSTAQSWMPSWMPGRYTAEKMGGGERWRQQAQAMGEEVPEENPIARAAVALTGYTPSRPYTDTYRMQNRGRNLKRELARESDDIQEQIDALKKEARKNGGQLSPEQWEQINALGAAKLEIAQRLMQEYGF